MCFEFRNNLSLYVLKIKYIFVYMVLYFPLLITVVI